MDKFDWTSVVFFIAPALILGGGIYLVVKNMLDRDYKIKLIETKRILQKDALPLRLQAYERMVLFLERVSPNNLLLREHTPGISAGEFHAGLLQTIRSEYEHNITQQIYVSAQAWNVVRNSKEDVIKLINSASQTINPNAPGLELSKQIFEIIIKNEVLPTQKAIDFVKAEVAQLF